MKEKLGYLPKNERKKILLICDDIRVHSGVATVTRELVINTAHHFNWVNLGGAIQHPDKGKRFDLSGDTNTSAGITDSSVILYPTDGYGNPDMIRQMMQMEQPDAIMLVTDPRYFEWLFAMENEIRKHCPIIYLNIWDDYPTPLYNKAFYESCDALLAISKQTKLINELVLGEKAENKVIKYVPHGLNEEIFKPLDDNDPQLVEFKKNLFGKDEKDFVLFFNSRNIRRKQIPDTMLAFRYFLDRLPKEKADKCAFILHTEVISEHGTDLEAVRKLFFKDYPNAIYFSTQRLDQQQLNMLYNIADAQILLTSNEGWGLSLTEAILAGTPIIANVTGGMQDQMRFEDENGNWIKFTPEFGSNHRGKYKKHGKWAYPVFPSNLSLVGSIPTPYIFDDRAEPFDIAAQISALYETKMTMPEKYAAECKAAHEWVHSEEAMMTAANMSKNVIEGIDKTFVKWTPQIGRAHV